MLMPKETYKNHYEELFSDENWLVETHEWNQQKQAFRETQFTIGNGDLCLRGVLEENPYDSYAGTYISGIYDRTGAQITEIVNLPNPLPIRIDVYGEKLDPVATDIVHHHRTLDLKTATLYRHSVYKTTHKKRLNYISRRFVSLHDKNLVVMEVEVTPLDAAMTINMQTGIDTGVTNKGTVTEGRKKHFMTCETSIKTGYNYLCVETFEKKVFVAYASALEIVYNGKARTVSERAVNLRVLKNETIIFRKYITVRSSSSAGLAEIKKETLSALKKARNKGFERLIAEHNAAWQKKWSVCDINIEGDEDATRALRFNIYHLIICGSETNDDASIGAKTLSGEGYRGHIFWDTELFILPFFIYTNPKVARNLLMYRYRRLDAARNNAAAKGYEGALFPWESADTGEECTPSWAKNFDGSIIKIVTMDEEHHIVSDIAYAFSNYAKVTGDESFLWKHAIELIVETARFWTSRVVLNRKKRRYEILHAMGPDEFHEDVDNNAYTNVLAKWNLLAACDLLAKTARKSPARLKQISKKLRIKPKEIAMWKNLGDRIHIPFSKKKRLIEQFDGYFRLNDHRITQLNDHFMPELPISLDWKDVSKTQFIKQADVVMLLYLLNDHFSHEEKRRNYYYYERRTLHKSSLSPAIHSIVGLEVGDEDKALHYFAHALSTDLSDIHGNSSDGIHAASAGGTWQAAIMGFAGLRPHDDFLALNPHLPSNWKKMSFAIWWRGALLKIRITSKKTGVEITKNPKNSKIFLQVYDQTQFLKPKGITCFERPETKRKKKRRES